MPEHVRKEIHSRVEQFRARRRGQTLPLPFEEQVLPDLGNIVAFPTLEPEPPVKPARRRSASEARAAACSTSAETSSPASSAVPALELGPVWAAPAPEPVSTTVDLAPQFPLFVPPSEQVRPNWHNFQIASLRKRLVGIAYDLANILAGIVLFASPFYWIAGKPHFSLDLLATLACGALLISSLYGVLFLAMVGETPGMSSAGLRVVSFSGQPASWQQRLLRAAGAVISAGSFLFGYLWACLDEEKLYWHDHISKTVLTDSGEENFLPTSANRTASRLN